MGTLNEYQYTFVIITHSILLRMANVSDKICGENQNTFLLNNIFFDNCAAYEFMWKNVIEPGRSHIIWRIQV